VSRTPVREALARLVEDGLVEIKPNRRSLVRKLGPDDLRHIYQVREALEGMAAELACGRFEPDELDALEQMADRARCDQTPGRAVDRQFDRDLHRLIAEHSGNPILAREIVKYRNLICLIREKLDQQADHRRLADEQHRAIIAALRSGDPAASRQAMVE